MLEQGERVIGGVRILMQAFGLKNAVIGVEANKEDAIEHLKALVGGKNDVQVESLRTRYPQGAEKQLIQRVTGREVPPGVLLAFVCAPTLPYWMLIIGDFFAIVVVKQLFGGLGKNFMNPALGGRAFLMLCYPVAMTTWVAPGIGTGAWADLLGGTKTMAGVDIVSSATPLSADFMHGGLLPDATILDTFVGNVGGCIGEISALALLLGGVYLIVRGVIRARIPVAYIATVAVLTFLFPLGGNDRLVWMTYQLFTGGLFLGAFFMATDYVTSPVTKKGEIIFGIGCGLLTVFIRYFGGYPEGVSYSILIMNCCVWLIDKVGKPGRYGVTKEMKAAAKAAKKAGKEG